MLQVHPTLLAAMFVNSTCRGCITKPSLPFPFHNKPFRRKLPKGIFVAPYIDFSVLLQAVVVSPGALSLWLTNDN
ncbi:hypothetical protein EMWEY_00009610 [Eimeria maxima]|uniref:Uncharacterized protein n=1 Tax=Eimeria maxima TaxID=5804 RepID=U6MDY1_EIMMA|nr:hypothetical protein EMWEY_00009610 [Eimeria maxima]CDJ61263.1 hypothetical protein EMWEY_00009610 [Eimeria maxima]